MKGGDDMLQQIVGKSMLETEFRRLLVADPKTASGREPGVTSPESKTVGVHESGMRTAHLALPPDPNIAGRRPQAVSAGLRCR